MFGKRDTVKGQGFKEQGEKLQKLESAVIEVTQRCPLKCRGCYVPAMPHDMALTEYMRVIDKLPFTRDALNISGGEPFLHEDLVGIAKYASMNKHNVYIFTSGYNGCLKLPELEPHIKGLRVTLKFPNELLDANWRGRIDSLQRTEDFIKSANKNDIKCYVHVVLDRRNIKYIEEICRYIEADLQSTPVFLPYIDYSREYAKYMFTWDEFKKNTKILEDEGFIVEMMEDTCIAGVDRVAIDSYGNVRPCVYVPYSCKLGNLLEESWNPIYQRLVQWRKDLGVYRGKCPAFIYHDEKD